MGGVGAGGLRDQAIEAMILAAANPVFDDGHTDVYYGGLLAAAEPFLRAQVIAEVVEALRARSEFSSDSREAFGYPKAAEAILAEFGGKHA